MTGARPCDDQGSAASGAMNGSASSWLPRLAARLLPCLLPCLLRRLLRHLLPCLPLRPFYPPPRAPRSFLVLAFRSFRVPLLPLQPHLPRHWQAAGPAAGPGQSAGNRKATTSSASKNRLAGERGESMEYGWAGKRRTPAPVEVRTFACLSSSARGLFNCRMSFVFLFLGDRIGSGDIVSLEAAVFSDCARPRDIHVERNMSGGRNAGSAQTPRGVTMGVAVAAASRQGRGATMC